MDNSALQELLDAAWSSRRHACVRGKRRVGAAVLSADGKIFAGCNIQQKFHTGDLHAEVTAIASMISSGRRKLRAVVIVSDGDGIAPCGACRDWILEFGVDESWVIWSGEIDGSRCIRRAVDLLPAHPSYE